MLPPEEIPSGEEVLETETAAEAEEQAVLEEELVLMSQNPDEVTLRVVQCSSTGIIVTKTRTNQILFEYDCWGILPLGVMPDGQGEKAVTWFKGYRYHGGFEYVRVTGGNLNVCNVVNLEDYVKGVIPYEMNPDWPAEALKAQSVCARTYVCSASKHQRAYGFDVCNTTDCQVYYGVGKATAASDAVVDATAGECLYHDGVLLADAVYHSSDGGATEEQGTSDPLCCVHRCLLGGVGCRFADPCPPRRKDEIERNPYEP
jgi:peptidoglycan hydrolase-like amidase